MSNRKYSDIYIYIYIYITVIINDSDNIVNGY